ncbi:urease accessory UreF family protein [Fodinicola feengrottensis]|uniref:Urease accessory UreF family protein n=1 Tax=Fodinicola feengrottensis TaxID=435914 RepID=A0ABN2HV20_9ACTN
MDVTALVLADSRFPGGGHVHSGGLEEAAARGLVRTVEDLAGFLTGRLATAGALAATFAAVATSDALSTVDRWLELDGEYDARTPSPAQRAASRAQGRATVRAGRAGWPSPILEALLAATPEPHHPIVLGALAGIAGAEPQDAALAAAYLAVSGPASAAVRLLGLDPFAVNATVVALSPRIQEIAVTAAKNRTMAPGDLPAPGGPGLDLLAEAQHRHHRAEVRLFAS